MRITILGSGTCTPRLDRSAAAVLVSTGRSNVLLDIGPGTMRRLLEAGHAIGDLTHIAITHFHPDHTAELVPLLFATRYAEAPPRTRPLTVLGGPGLKAFFSGLQAVYGHWIILPDDLLQVREIDDPAGAAQAFADFTLSAFPVDHRPESLAYRIADAAGRTVACSGDSDVCDGLVAAARAADLFICEASKPDGLKTAGHLTPSLAGRMAARAGAKRLVLTHLYPSCDAVDIVKQATATYKGPVVAATDLMRFTLDQPDGGKSK